MILKVLLYKLNLWIRELHCNMTGGHEWDVKPVAELPIRDDCVRFTIGATCTQCKLFTYAQYAISGKLLQETADANNGDDSSVRNYAKAKLRQTFIAQLGAKAKRV